MKNPFKQAFKFIFTPDYEKKIKETLEESLYDARMGLLRATEAKHRADASVSYSTTRVEHLKKELSLHKEALDAEVYNLPVDIINAVKRGVSGG